MKNSYSDSQFLHFVHLGQEQEGGVGFSLGVVAEAQGGFGVEALSAEDLEFVVLSHDELNHGSGGSLEILDVLFWLLLTLHMVHGSFKQGLDSGHEVFF